jgi:hypothetical protein
MPRPISANQASSTRCTQANNYILSARTSRYCRTKTIKNDDSVSKLRVLIVAFFSFMSRLIEISIHFFLQSSACYRGIRAVERKGLRIICLFVYIHQDEPLAHTVGDKLLEARLRSFSTYSHHGQQQQPEHVPQPGQTVVKVD